MRTADLNSALAMLALDHGVLSCDQARELIADRTRPDAEIISDVVAIAQEAPILAALARELGLRFINLASTDNTYRPMLDPAEGLDVERLEHASALPVLDADGHLSILMANPRADSDTVEYLKTFYGPDLRVHLGIHTQIQSELVKMATPIFDDVVDERALKRKAKADAAPVQVNESPVVAWVDNLLARASAENASDVHFMTQMDKSLWVRFRIDGHLREQVMPLRGRESEVIGTLLSRCPTIDSTDRGRAQDGAFSFLAAGGRTIDTRLSMMPQVHGPLVVIRLLDPLNVQRRLDSMGFAPQTLEVIRAACNQAQGLVLVIGPTGSGKTTTLYAVLNELDSQTKHILTAEDPVEYRLPGIGQTQIRSDLGAKSLTFARALRGFLRLDPDIILVGEIRDSDTADVAMHAALTGHLVLSTIHANSALGVFQRLEELGGEPYLVAEALSLAVSQRLIARVHDCREMVPITAGQAAFLKRNGLEPVETVAKPVGCHACANTGYKGRIPVMEVLRPNDKVRELVATRAPMSEIAEAAEQSGWTSIFADAYRHVAKGESTIQEMLRVLDTGKGGQ